MTRRISMGFNWQGPLDHDKAYESARIADEVGVDSMWVAEAWGRDAFSLLTLVADRTKRIKLGTSIVNIYSRTPAALAQHFATLDELSGGRVIIGLGTSGKRVIEHFHGVRFEPARLQIIARGAAGAGAMQLAFEEFARGGDDFVERFLAALAGFVLGRRFLGSARWRSAA